ncbi:MAG: hypothetical protein JWO06_557, partial [Bacteroidota bacterium]|nr:hypothetical protein [Bacteroidota bacterium]
KVMTGYGEETNDKIDYRVDRVTRYNRH